jgi:modification methylase
VLADASLECGAVQGSIHKVGAALQGAPSCNGWTFWHLDGEPIDALRQRYQMLAGLE